METSYDVRIWSIRTKAGAGRRRSYTVRWFVADQPFSLTYATKALAEGFRSDLVSGQRRGEAFRRSDGLPVSMARVAGGQSWFEFAQRYVDTKWPLAAGKSRAGNADTMATATMALLSSIRGQPSAAALRKAMTGWAFNTKRRDGPMPEAIKSALRWLADNTMPVAELEDQAVVRRVLEQLAMRMDGKPAAGKTVARKRAVLHNALEYAVEWRLITRNRIADVKWSPPKEVKAIDKRVVINPRQATALLAAVGGQVVPNQPRRSAGPTLVAFFGALYYSGLWPEEAAMLSKPDLALPTEGWGELMLSQAAPIAGPAWTDSGQRRDRRHLKQRARGEARPVPCPPPLTALLHDHLARFGTAADGRLFRNLAGGDLSESTIARVWDKARRAALSPEEYASPLGRRPYDLRHACVSTWLMGGVPSTQVAEWAGHSVAVLHQIYAKVIAGQEIAARQRIEAALGLGPGAGPRIDREQPGFAGHGGTGPDKP